MELRLAYGASEHCTDSLKKMMDEHREKQTNIANKINKIVGEHEEKLKRRIRERKEKTVSRSEVHNHS
jgi:hypothetical protein